MIPLVRGFLHELLWSPERARVWLRSVLAWAFGTAAQVVAAPPEQVALWSKKDWAIRLGISGVLGLALLIKAGEKNATVEPPAGSAK